MGFFQGSFYSEALKRNTHLSVYKPIGFRAESKVIVFLHGIADNDHSWITLTSACRLAEQTNTALVFADCNRSFYINTYYGARYHDYINQELPKAIHFFFNLPNEKERLYIAGNSMGGYGALRAYLQPNSCYGAVIAFSPVTNLRQCYDQLLPPDLSLPNEPEGLFGPCLIDAPENDLFDLLKQKAEEDLNITIYCGAEDFLKVGIDAFHRHMEDNNVKHKYVVDAGEHNWSYWDRAVVHLFNQF